MKSRKNSYSKLHRLIGRGSSGEMKKTIAIIKIGSDKKKMAYKYKEFDEEEDIFMAQNLFLYILYLPEKNSNYTDNTLTE